MKREVLYRGLDKESKSVWYEGYYWETSDTTYCFKEEYDSDPNNTHHYILFDEMTDFGLPNRKMKVEIDRDTLCQCTNRKDINGNKIFENDIIEGRKGLKGVVKYDEKRLTFIVKTKNLKYTLHDMPTEIGVKVIGDIFNNEDLIK